MAEKKRKRNWYIYLITFAIAMGLAVLAVQSLQSVLFPEKNVGDTGYGAVSYLPSSANDMNTLVMLSEMKAGVPELYLIVGYRPNKEVISCVPVNKLMKATVGGATLTLSDHYRNGGAETVMYALQNVLGVKFDNYVKFDRLSFISFIDEIGKVSVTTSYEIPSGELDEEGRSVPFLEVGTHALGGADLYTYLTYNNPELGADYQVMVLGSVAISIFNNNFRNLSSTLLQSHFNKIINVTDTNMLFEDYTMRQQAFLYTSGNSYNPAVYYIPYGSYDETDGSFIISEGSVATVKDRLGIE